MASSEGGSEEERRRLCGLFRGYGAEQSGRIDRGEFFSDVDGDDTITLDEFIGGFTDQQLEERDDGDSTGEGRDSYREELVLYR